MESENSQQSDEVQELRDTIEDLKRALVEEKKQRKWPWLVRTVVPIVVASFCTGAGGYFFGDSLEERSRTETRREVLKMYFSIDNKTAGKRKQVLTFIEDYLAKGDPELMGWVKKEKNVVDKHLVSLQNKIESLNAEIKRLEEKGESVYNKKEELTGFVYDSNDLVSTVSDPKEVKGPFYDRNGKIMGSVNSE